MLKSLRYGFSMRHRGSSEKEVIYSIRMVGKAQILTVAARNSGVMDSQLMHREEISGSSELESPNTEMQDSWSSSSGRHGSSAIVFEDKFNSKSLT
jgi:hypothetical protein